MFLSGTNLVLPLHVARLSMNGTLLIPTDAWPVVLEIGASDRNTLHECLSSLAAKPATANAFLVTAEPLIEKYARGLAKDRRGDGDGFQPLGHHHKNGIILPLAVGPAEGAHKLNVNSNAGCSSMLAPSRSLTRWCSKRLETRVVPVVRLERLLGWINHPIEFARIDAQGLDLSIVESGGALLSQRVRRLVLEVLADDCKPHYEGQPNCSSVMERMQRLGFRPVQPISCVPPGMAMDMPPPSITAAGMAPPNPKPALVGQRRGGACELDILFLSARTPDPPRAKWGSRFMSIPAPSGELVEVDWWGYHGLKHNGCEAAYYPHDMKAQLSARPPPGKVVLGEGELFYSAEWKRPLQYAMGRSYLCSNRTVQTAERRRATGEGRSSNPRTPPAGLDRR